MSQGLTLDNATTFLADARDRLAGGQTVIDLAGLAPVDSSALAVLLALARQAPGGCEFSNPPDSLLNLARLYGVDGLLFPTR